MSSRKSQRALADAVARMVGEADWVTFVQLARFLESLEVPCGGEMNLALSGDSNVLLWSGMSERMCGLLVQLLREGRIFAHRSSVAAYHLQGGVLNLPLAHKPRRGGLASPHWLPVAFRTVPPAWALH
jgi:hypothetical protein